MTTTPLTDQQLADAFVAAAAADTLKPHAERSGLVNVMLAVVRPELDRLTAELGRELFLVENTIKTHLQRAYRKLGARDRAHAVALALQQGILTPQDVQSTSGTWVGGQGPQAAVQRVRFLLGDWQRSGGPPAAHLAGHWWDHKLTQLATAVGDNQAPTP